MKLQTPFVELGKSIENLLAGFLDNVEKISVGKGTTELKPQIAELEAAIRNFVRGDGRKLITSTGMADFESFVKSAYKDASEIAKGNLDNFDAEYFDPAYARDFDMMYRLIVPIEYYPFRFLDMMKECYEKSLSYDFSPILNKREYLYLSLEDYLTTYKDFSRIWMK